jgi:hypothetical protein
VENTYRFRFLIYLAAFILVMSLCFVYAEPVPACNPLLFQIAPQHAGFLAPSKSQPSFDPAALRAATSLSSSQVPQLGEKTHARRGFFHRPRKSPAEDEFVVVNVPDESSVLVLTRRPSAVSNTR